MPFAIMTSPGGERTGQERVSVTLRPPAHPRPHPRPAEPRGDEGARPAAPCVHSVHGQRGRPRARLRRPVRSAAEGVPRPRLRHQLHPGRRSALPGPAAGWQWLVARPRKGRAEGPPPHPPGQPRAPAGRASPAEAAQGCAGRVQASPEPRGEPGGGGAASPPPAAHAPRPQVHGQVLYTASHDGALRLWDVRGLPPPRAAAPKRSLSRLFSNKVGCAAAPLPPA